MYLVMVSLLAEDLVFLSSYKSSQNLPFLACRIIKENNGKTQTDVGPVGLKTFVVGLYNLSKVISI
jgi:hypothetical protein